MWICPPSPCPHHPALWPGPASRRPAAVSVGSPAPRTSPTPIVVLPGDGTRERQTFPVARNDQGLLCKSLHRAGGGPQGGTPVPTHATGRPHPRRRRRRPGPGPPPAPEGGGLPEGPGGPGDQGPVSIPSGRPSPPSLWDPVGIPSQCMKCKLYKFSAIPRNMGFGPLIRFRPLSNKTTTNIPPSFALTSRFS